MELYLGIDGGQSSTTVLIGDDSGRVIGWARGGPCNHVSAAEAAEKFTRVIGDCVAEACANAGIDAGAARFTATCCGMSGGPADKQDLLRRTIRTGKLRVVTDGQIALTGALAGGPGIIVIAGTGSLALGRDGIGRLARAGGWGFVFGDEGSAFDIARQALRAALREEEGWGAKTRVRAALLEASGAASANELMHLFYTAEWPRARVAQLARFIDDLSSSGDAAARSILDQAGQSLAALAACVRGVLFAEGEPVNLSFVGGVFRSPTVLARFRILAELSEGCRCVAPLLDPAAGALLEAYREEARAVMVSHAPALK